MSDNVTRDATVMPPMDPDIDIITGPNVKTPFMMVHSPVFKASH